MKSEYEVDPELPVRPKSEYEIDPELPARPAFMNREYPVFSTCTELTEEDKDAGRREASAVASSLGFTVTASGGRHGDDVLSAPSVFEAPSQPLIQESVDENAKEELRRQVEDLRYGAAAVAAVIEAEEVMYHVPATTEPELVGDWQGVPSAYGPAVIHKRAALLHTQGAAEAAEVAEAVAASRLPRLPTEVATTTNPLKDAQPGSSQNRGT